MGEFVLKGDTENFPGAYLEFKLKVCSPMKADGRISTMVKSNNGSSTMFGNSMDTGV